MLRGWVTRGCLNTEQSGHFKNTHQAQGDGKRVGDERSARSDQRKLAQISKRSEFYVFWETKEKGISQRWFHFLSLFCYRGALYRFTTLCCFNGRNGGQIDT